MSLVVSPPLGFANDFAILVRGDVARKDGLKTISDAVPVSKNWQAGFGQDFMSRADGYPGFVKAYGFDFAKQPREMDLSLTYKRTKVRRARHHRRQLDRRPYLGLRTISAQRRPALFPAVSGRVHRPAKRVCRNSRTAFDSLKDAISTEEMRKLNYEVDGNKRSPKDVAAEWLASR